MTFLMWFFAGLTVEECDVGSWRLRNDVRDLLAREMTSLFLISLFISQNLFYIHLDLVSASFTDEYFMII